MTNPPAIAFLIDADNLNDPDAVAEAFEQLHKIAGVSTIRRAYGSNDSLRGLSPVLKQYAVRPCANFVLDKNTTDMALAVDAMEIACQAEPPAVIALGSGDTDFYPLVVRLRERGVRVISFSLAGKMNDDMRSACAELFFVGSAAARTVARPASAPAPRKTAARKTVARPVPAPPAAVPVPSPVAPPPARKAAARKPAARVSAPAVRGDATPSVQAILAAVPALRDGLPLRIDQAGPQLHEAAVIGKSASPARLFRRFADAFELTPAGKPNHVRWLGARGA